MDNINKKIILSFDVEFWSDAKYLKKYLSEFKNYPGDYLEESILPILNLLEKYKTKATFFVTGEAVEKYPELIKIIYTKGHEIASHGYSHQPLENLTPDTFKDEIKKAIGFIENVTGKKPKGFRAPRFSLNNRTRWAVSILSELGFKYDSSIFPLRIPYLYGVNRAPNCIYRISFKDVSKINPDSPLIEIPMTLYNFCGIKIPVAGGVYFRLMPFFLYKRILKATFKKRIPVLYFHPHELYQKTPIIEGAPWFIKKLKYCGIKNSLEKLEKLLQIFKFDSVENILKL